jgi:hypothetical protein
VEEEEVLDPVEDYELTLKIGIVKELETNLLTHLYRHQDIQYIFFDDVSNP